MNESALSPKGIAHRNRRALAELGQRLGIEAGDYAAWYRITGTVIRENGGKALLRRFDNSVTALITSTFPEHAWDLADFAKKPQAFWSSPSNVRDFALSLGQKLGLPETDPKAWYKLSHKDIKANGGAGIFKRFDNSLYAFLTAAFPEHDWREEAFPKRPQGYWKSKDNQIKGLEDIRLKLGIAPGDMEPWYKVGFDEIVKAGGYSLLNQFGGSPARLLLSVYPDYDWKIWKFLNTRSGLKDSADYFRSLAAFVEKSLGFKTAQDWSRVTEEQLAELGVLHVIKEKGGLTAMLSILYPNLVWDKTPLSQKSSSLPIRRT